MDASSVHGEQQEQRYNDPTAAPLQNAAVVATDDASRCARNGNDSSGGGGNALSFHASPVNLSHLADEVAGDDNDDVGDMPYVDDDGDEEMDDDDDNEVTLLERQLHKSATVGENVGGSGGNSNNNGRDVVSTTSSMMQGGAVGMGGAGFAQQQQQQDSATLLQHASGPRRAVDDNMRRQRNKNVLQHWMNEPVDTTSQGYQEVLQYVEAHFDTWLRECALQGEMVLPGVTTPEHRHAVVHVASRHGYDADLRYTTCHFAYAEATNRLYLRCNLSNPHVATAIADELYQLEEEHRRRTSAGQQGAATALAPYVLRWYFVDRVLHNDATQLLRMLAYEIGVFRGVLATSYREQCNTPGLQGRLEPVFVYKIEVGLVYLPEWRHEREELVSESSCGVSHPFPLPKIIAQNRQCMLRYRRFVRPFLYNWNPTVTRCSIDTVRGRDFQGNTLPTYVHTLTHVCALRSDTDEAGRVFFRLSIRHSLSIFSRFAPALERRDAQSVLQTLQRLYTQKLREEQGDGSSSSSNSNGSAVAATGGDGALPLATREALLAQAKETTPPFGIFNFCLENGFVRKDLDELQNFAQARGYYIYIRRNSGLSFIAGVSRDLPVLPRNEFELFFLPGGAYVGPVHFRPCINNELGHSLTRPVSLHSLLDQVASDATGAARTVASASRRGEAAEVQSTKVTSQRAHDEQTAHGHTSRRHHSDRRRERSQRSSRSDSSHDSRQRHRHHRRRRYSDDDGDGDGADVDDDDDALGDNAGGRRRGSRSWSTRRGRGDSHDSRGRRSRSRDGSNSSGRRSYSGASRHDRRTQTQRRSPRATASAIDSGDAAVCSDAGVGGGARSADVFAAGNTTNRIAAQVQEQQQQQYWAQSHVGNSADATAANGAGVLLMNQTATNGTSMLPHTSHGAALHQQQQQQRQPMTMAASTPAALSRRYVASRSVAAESLYALVTSRCGAQVNTSPAVTSEVRWVVWQPATEQSARTHASQPPSGSVVSAPTATQFTLNHITRTAHIAQRQQW